MKHAAITPLILAILLGLLACETEGAGDGWTGSDSAELEGDTTTPGDVTTDTGAPDTKPVGPQGRVFEHDPTTDQGATVVVDIPHVSSDDGRLTGPYAQTYNCLNDDQGKEILYRGTTVQMCSPTATVFPGDDGSYLHVDLPQDWKDPNDAFAELQMYVHLNRVHDYFAQTLGVTHMDFPIVGLVNIGMKVYGFWRPFDNAAFMPEATIAAFGLDLGIEGDAVVFGQGSYVDFSYDTSVIYHEYTHAVIGEGRLMGNAADQYGLNPDPPAINEASADYFAATQLGNPAIGVYALDMPYMKMMRNLAEERTCPEHLVGESHHDGRMWASGLWAIRDALGAEAADGIIFRALMQYGLNTTFAEASQILMDEAALVSPEAHDAVAAALAERNLIACERIKAFENQPFVAADEPIQIAGLYTSGLMQFDDYTPMAFQYVLDVPHGKKALYLEYKARVSDQMAMMGYSMDAGVDVAVRAGSPITYEYVGGKAQSSAQAVLKPDNGYGGTSSLVISGSCLQPGPLYIQFVNLTYVDVQFDSMSATFLYDDSEYEPNFVCP
jgi:hypothetical protein